MINIAPLSIKYMYSFNGIQGLWMMKSIKEIYIKRKCKKKIY